MQTIIKDYDFKGGQYTATFTHQSNDLIKVEINGLSLIVDVSDYEDKEYDNLYDYIAYDLIKLFFQKD